MYELKSKFEDVGWLRKTVSSPKSSRWIGTELKFEVAKSQAKKKNQQALENFLSGIQILPIFPALDIYASEKARLQKFGKIIDDFDLLIGAKRNYSVARERLKTIIPDYSQRNLFINKALLR